MSRLAFDSAWCGVVTEAAGRTFLVWGGCPPNLSEGEGGAAAAFSARSRAAALDASRRLRLGHDDRCEDLVRTSTRSRSSLCPVSLLTRKPSTEFPRDLVAVLLSVSFHC